MWKEWQALTYMTKHFTSRHRYSIVQTLKFEMGNMKKAMLVFVCMLKMYFFAYGIMSTWKVQEISYCYHCEQCWELDKWKSV